MAKTPVTPDPGSQFDAMDRMYRFQRHFYDATRKFFLLGRDRLIEQMAIRDGDFCDQSELPAWFQKLLKKWLDQFHVRFPEGLFGHLESLETQGLGELRVETLYRRYSFVAEFRLTLFPITERAENAIVS